MHEAHLARAEVLQAPREIRLAVFDEGGDAHTVVGAGGAFGEAFGFQLQLRRLNEVHEARELQDLVRAVPERQVRA